MENVGWKTIFDVVLVVVIVTEFRANGQSGLQINDK